MTMTCARENPHDLTDRISAGVSGKSIDATAAWRTPERLIRAFRSILSTWRRRDRDRRELAAMSDRELADIGESRVSIAWEIERPFWRN